MKIKSKELVKILKDRDKVNQEVKENNKALVKHDKIRQKLIYKQERLKVKGVKVLDKEFKKAGGLKEFEYFVTYELSGDDEVNIEVGDIFNDAFKNPEDLKEKLRNDKKDGEGFWTDELMYIGHEK